MLPHITRKTEVFRDMGPKWQARKINFQASAKKSRKSAPAGTRTPRSLYVLFFRLGWQHQGNIPLTFRRPPMGALRINAGLRGSSRGTTVQPYTPSDKSPSTMDTVNVLEYDGETPQGSQYELSKLKPEASTNPPSPSNGSKLTVLEHSEPQEGTTIQELAPVDRGFGAWSFCACGFVAEMFIWGFLFR